MEKGKVLIVDDEEIFLVATQRELEAAGHDVKIALSGKKAIEIAKSGKFDIVYTDLVMPEMNGVELCKEIKKISPKTEVILISGHPNEIQEHQSAFWDAGGKDKILRKPLGNDELTNITEKALKEIKERGEVQDG